MPNCPLLTWPQAGIVVSPFAPSALSDTVFSSGLRLHWLVAIIHSQCLAMNNSVAIGSLESVRIFHIWPNSDQSSLAIQACLFALKTGVILILSFFSPY